MFQLEALKGKLIVSCQALENEPLHSSFIMGRMALAAEEGGAKGIRANSVTDINEIKKQTELPVIGIIKRDYDDSEVYITPTMKEVEELLTTSAEIIALDATKQTRPDNEKASDLVERIHRSGRLAMADISTLSEALQAEKDGFDLVSTTLAGYTSYSRKTDTPDFDLLKEIVQQVDVPVIMEGHTDAPEQVTKALELGAFSVVVGSIITRPQLITKRYVEAADKVVRMENDER
ncbi:N-acetylmannosamine-6-phosphate 2-epimerase [Enterococcus sp. DIV0242_7C1]|uniref:Putative N-acetylmannosamine-6-phosphate 2-epimerase n=1 Tax=Candidatus Enterococcus dunnyi TaxID=1834192 RepID=A0A200JDF7_9ENTE|nr:MULTISPECIES: N-acetylmannosamine-6-phosphate 2-epimerase [unclassified Enterococcus]MBO0469461.1 N-acetylmannosamine-6-phosphate 2-epimerase [Enterococcus sp. DIV0242_7C1]OUZ35243.1 N-acetylmannosamine-6-phosphate 2-epimerase [Enterococcus sp. 9D6_DIV0238]